MKACSHHGWGASQVVIAVLALCCLAPWSVVSAQDKKPPQPAQKKFTFDLRNKPWSATFERLQEVTGLPVLAHAKPQEVICCAPQTASREYTLIEILDLLNEALMVQKQRLI